MAVAPQPLVKFCNLVGNDGLASRHFGHALSQGGFHHRRNIVDVGKANHWHGCNAGVCIGGHGQIQHKLLAMAIEVLGQQNRTAGFGTQQIDIKPVGLRLPSVEGQAQAFQILGKRRCLGGRAVADAEGATGQVMHQIFANAIARLAGTHHQNAWFGQLHSLLYPINGGVAYRYGAAAEPGLGAYFFGGLKHKIDGTIHDGAHQPLLLRHGVGLFMWP